MRVDTTSGTPGDRVRLYVNGELESGGYTQGYNSIQLKIAINYYNVELITLDEIGHSTQYNACDGRMTHFYWIDGQSLGPEEFGFTDPLTNTWRPKKYEQLGPNNGTNWSSRNNWMEITNQVKINLVLDLNDGTFWSECSNQIT